MDDKKLAEELKALMSGDAEVDHGVADDFVAKVLRDSGYPELSITYLALCGGFWYA